MATNVIVGDTTRISVTFRGFEESDDTGDIEDPTSVAVNIFDTSFASPALLSYTVPTRVSAGVYRYDWTPSIPGTFRVQFVGIFADSSRDVVNNDFVVSYSFTTTSSQTLETDQTILFSSGFQPFYVNPDELLAVFPDADAVEVAEYVYLYSLEFRDLFGESATPNYLGLEYIKAATACALSKVYDASTGDELSIRLGDLSVTNRNFPKSKISRGNATTWCELAAALRIELISTRVGMLTVVKGQDYPNPMPSRVLRDIEKSTDPSPTRDEFGDIVDNG